MLAGILFDLDGTLLDTAGDFVDIIQRMRADRGLPPAPESLVRSRVSDGSAGMLSAAFDSSPQASEFDLLREDFLQRYAAQLAMHTRLYPGIAELLDWLDAEGLPWGVVTNKMSRFSIPLLQAMQLDRRCASLVCPDQVSQPKPHPEPLFKACSEMRVTPQHCVFVGDHRRDIEAGRAAGMRTAAALYGYLSSDDPPATWQADHSVQHAAELLPWLQQLRQQEIFDV
ncbi:phosphoglycolate phosphatase [Halopseudomonas yangmingensis]|uniref:phosphoglycolate phosphatase n=1 Tax=Halopseudomonas yangmingensis TaxID=1720063 RepID=A0A1I4S698_9GAMM|nr:phosphoglycolate phosphatase [Halopseudomonas yangmingensis]SFM60025.1 phosphoglycolate phosphatase [Halopseudomonas yangmingensis]